MERTFFNFGAPYGCSTQDNDKPQRHTCGLCRARFNDHGLSVWLNVPYAFPMCGDCLRATPRRLAELARRVATVLRKRPDHPGDDPNTNIEFADQLLEFADHAETLNSIDPIMNGTIARKIGEAYRELDARPARRRSGKAA